MILSNITKLATLLLAATLTLSAVAQTSALTETQYCGAPKRDFSGVKRIVDSYERKISASTPPQPDTPACINKVLP